MLDQHSTPERTATKTPTGPTMADSAGHNQLADVSLYGAVATPCSM